MDGNTLKEMTTNFEKLDKFEVRDFRRWQKKMHFLLTKLKVVYVLTTPMPELMEDSTVEAIRISAKWENDDYICRGHILNGMSDSLFDVYTNAESAKELWDSLESKYMAEDFSSKKFLVSNFNNYKMVDSRTVMEQYNELFRILGQYIQHGLKMDEFISVSSIIDKLPPSWKNFKHTLKHGKDDLFLVQLGSHLRIEESLRAQDSDKGKDDASRFYYVYLLHAKDKALDKFKIYKIEVELQQNDLIKTLRTDGGDEYYDPVFFQSVGIIHETTALYTPQQNGVAERKNIALKEMVNSMLPYSGLSEGFRREAMLTACYLLNRVPNKKNKTTPYELWYKKRPNLLFLRVWGCRAVVRLPDPKRKTVGEKGIDCIFVGYAEHSKAYRFYVIEPNDSISINSIIESRDAIFD
nr:zinc finger, CCHC-type [Tanacetum cinerariifolium]